MAQSDRHRQLRWNIITERLPNAVWRFLNKNEDYGTGSDEFGLAAQVHDLSRKYKKVFEAVINGKELTGEPLEEVIEDMIGHALLMLEQLGVSESGHAVEFTAEDWLYAYSQGMVHLNG